MMQRLGQSYDIVLANIVADVIIPLASVVPNFLSSDSIFICSGILDSRLNDVLCAIEDAGMQVLSVDHQEDWCRITAVLAE